MPKKYKVLSAWFQKTDDLGYVISAWCKKLNDREAFCNVCEKKIGCEAKGFAAITQHVKREVHKVNASTKLDPTQCKFKVNSEKISESILSNEQPNLELVSDREAITKAELIWAMKSIQCNMAAGTSDDLKDIFSAMFPGSIAETFQLGRTKLSYLITEALGPYFKKQLSIDIDKSFFTLLFGETTNNAGKKELQFQIMYWSEQCKEVVCRHLQTVFIGHAAADDIVRELENVLNNANLPLNRLLMLGSDGPRVNQKVWRLLNDKLIDERKHGLVDIGTCSIHLIHNAFLKGLEEYGDCASELLTDIYNFFKKFPSRWEDYEKIQVKKDVSRLKFLKHVLNRWLTLGPATERFLEQWLAVVEYFSVYLPEKEKRITQTEKYKRIMKAIRIADIKAELNFIVESSKLYGSFLENFQKSEPLIHVLDTEIKILLKKISGRICKPNVEINGTIAIENLRKETSLDCDELTRKEINKLRENDKLDVYRKIQRHYMCSYNYIWNNISKRDSLLTDLRCLSIGRIALEKSVSAIGKIARSFAFIDVKEVDVKDEWRILQTESDFSSLSCNIRIDHFWRNIIYKKTDLGHLKYPSLSKLIKVCLSLSHGNSEVERGFSVFRRILSEDKSSMSERVLNDRLLIRDSIKLHSKVSEIPITKELLNFAYGARKSYQLYLDDQKKKKEEELRVERENEENLKEKKKQEENLLNLKGSVKKLEEKAKIVNRERKEIGKSADELFKEANKRLKLAIDDKNIESIRIAQGMIEGSLKLKEKERECEQEENRLNRVVNKRKSNLIESFFNKKPKA